MMVLIDTLIPFCWKNFKKNELKIYIFLIILLAIVLRLYQAPQLFVFSGDEEHQLSIAQTIVKHFHIEWVGVSSADTGFYLGPFWEYFGAFWLFISQNNPEIVAYVAAVIGVCTTILIYLVGRKLFNQQVALIASLIYASLPLLVYYDKKFWNPSLTSITALSLFFALVQTKQSKWWWLLVAFIYGMAFHVHLSLVPLAIIIIYWYFKIKSGFNFKVVVLSILLFVMIVSPLIAFDYLHDWTNLKTPLRVGNAVNLRPQRVDPIEHTKQLFRSLGRFWYLYPNRSNSDEVLHSCSMDYLNKNLLKDSLTTTTSKPLFLASFFSIFLLCSLLFKKSTWQNDHTKLLALFLLTILTCYIFLPNIPLEYYLLGVFPLLTFIPGLLYYSLPRNTRIIVLVIIFLTSILGSFTILSAKDDFGLSRKKALIQEVTQYVNGSPFELKEEGLCHKYEGWRFLFKAYGQKPVKSSTDKTLGWLYRDEILNTSPKYLVIMAESRAYLNQHPNFIANFKSGGFEADIFLEDDQKNSK